MKDEEAIIPNFRIRPAVVTDRISISQVQAKVWKSTYRGMIPDIILAQMIAADRPLQFENSIDPMMNSQRALVAQDAGGGIIGFVLSGLPRNSEWGYQSELWALYVLQAHQGQGIGTSLFKAMRKDLSERYNSMIVWALEANHPSHQFYERMGGKLLAMRKPFIWENRLITTEIAYAWSL